MSLNQSLEKALTEMIAERDRLNAAIRELEKIVSASPVAKRGPGRPKGSTSTKGASKAAAGAKRSRAWSPAARKAAAERMKKYWAERKKAKS